MTASEADWESVKEEIRNRADIVNVVEDYVSLEKRGENHWALCPFHNEDTASFSVNPNRGQGIYKCFGCGVGGDVFDFVMRVEQCDFMEALRMLSNRTGVELPETGDDQDREDSPRQRMFDLNGYVAERFREAYESDAGEPARSYMEDRGFDPGVLETFNVGYAPDGWDNLIRAMKRDGFDLRVAMKLGLIDTSEKSDGPYDKFRNRVMFPIETLGGRVVAFGGRTLEADPKGPKYLNSQESPIFSKREFLYGLPQARSSIRRKDYCMIMEGYTDVIKCHQHGFDTAVASLGTAMTEQHARTLKGYTDEVVLVYDGDEAGRRAARRGGEIALEHGIKASVVLLEEGEDPADVIKESAERFKQLLADREPFLEVVRRWLSEQHDTSTTDGKTEVLREIIPLIKQLPGEVDREQAARTLAEQLDVRDETVLNMLNRKQSSRSDSGESQLTDRIKGESGVVIEEFFFRCVGAQPETAGNVLEMLVLKDFEDSRSKQLFEGLRDVVEDGTVDVDDWMDAIPDDLVSYLAGLLNKQEGRESVEKINPARVAEKIRSDSSRRERARLAEALEEEDAQSGAGEFDEAKKSLLKQAMEMKQEEQNVEE